MHRHSTTQTHTHARTFAKSNKQAKVHEKSNSTTVWKKYNRYRRATSQPNETNSYAGAHTVLYTHTYTATYNMNLQHTVRHDIDPHFLPIQMATFLLIGREYLLYEIHIICNAFSSPMIMIHASDGPSKRLSALLAQYKHQTKRDSKNEDIFAKLSMKHSCLSPARVPLLARVRPEYACM